MYLRVFVLNRFGFQNLSDSPIYSRLEFTVCPVLGENQHVYSSRLVFTRDGVGVRIRTLFSLDHNLYASDYDSDNPVFTRS